MPPLASRTTILYVSYDGVLEPLGDSQVVSYLERLAATFDIALLSFEKPYDLDDYPRVQAMERRLHDRGIAWIRLRYHRRPPVASTAFDVLVGMWRARAACRSRGIRIVHARSHVSALIALGSRGASGARFLFDMRGFWVDEKVVAGHWTAGGALYRVGKYWERRFFRSADAIVSLTAAGVRAFSTLGYDVPPDVPVEVIPTCVDLQRFQPAGKDPALLGDLGLAGSRVIGCVGTMSNWYMRAEMLTYLAMLCRSFADMKILLVTREDHNALRRDAHAAGVPPDRLVLTEAPFADMPRFTRLFDAGVFFIRPVLSKRGSAATKLAEFLACGVPVIINAGVGDSGAIVAEQHVGVVLPDLETTSMERSLAVVAEVLEDPTIAARCRETASAQFDVEVGVARFGALYRRLSTNP